MRPLSASFIFLTALTTLPLFAQSAPPPDPVVFPTAHGEQTETDEYTRYELLAPENRKLQNLLRSHGHDSRRPVLLQPYPQRQRGHRRERHRRQDRQAPRLLGRPRRRSPSRPAHGSRRPRHRLHQGHARTPRPRTRPGPRPHRQNLQRPRKLLRGWPRR